MTNVNEGAGVPEDAIQKTKTSQVDLSAVIAAQAEAMAELRQSIRDAAARERALRAELESASAEVDVVIPGVANTSTASSKERWAITLDEGQDINAPSDVPIQPNGRVYNIQRGKRVEVPWDVISVLQDAVVDKTIPQIDNAGMPNGFITRPMRRFPFQIHGQTVDKDGKRLDEQATVTA